MVRPLGCVIGWIVGGGLAFLILIAGGCTWHGYNTVNAMDERVESSWAQVENQLQRRYDLIPNLVATVKGVAQQEREVYATIAEARTRYFNARTLPERAEAAEAVEGSLLKLMNLAENYPQLRSSEAFLKLQDQLEGTENRLSVERKRYNDAVEALNAYIRKIPGKLWASLAGVERAEYFEITTPEAERPPTVDFGS